MDRPAVVVRWALVSRQVEALSLSHRVALLAAGAVLDVPSHTLALSHRCPRCGSTAHGTPHIIGRSVAVSLSRARGAVVAAATSHEAVLGLGIDVEARDVSLERRGLKGLDMVALSPAERVRRQSGAPCLTTKENPDLRAWVRKEAILKALGTGLATDPSSITLDGTAVVEGPHGPWWVEDLSLADGLLASVAVRGVASAGETGVSILSQQVDAAEATSAC